MGQLKGIAIRGASRAAMEEVDSVSVSVEAGLAGDRHGDMAARQVTVLSATDWRAVCDELGADLPWTVRRANCCSTAWISPASLAAVSESANACSRSPARPAPASAWTNSTTA